MVLIKFRPLRPFSTGFGHRTWRPWPPCSHGNNTLAYERLASPEQTRLSAPSPSSAVPSEYLASLELSKSSAQTPSSVCVRVARREEELVEAAWLRAEAYHEVRQYGRFTRSFVKQFAQQEARNLVRRAREAAQYGSGPPQWVTLVALQGGAVAAAVDSGGGGGDVGAVVGTLDLRLATGVQLEEWAGSSELPEGPCRLAAYLSNVAVAPAARGRGVGSLLLACAKQVAAEALGVQQVYAHVEAENELALRLYRKYGFQEAGKSWSAADGALPPGRLILVCCPL